MAPRLLWCVAGVLSLFVIVTSLPVGDAQVTSDNGTSAAPVEQSGGCASPGECRDGILIPMWRPQNNLSKGDIAARAIVYFTTLSFMFLGVSIIADRFMASIEVITSKERDVTIKKPNGETTIVSVRVWNETVSNLTLMALGSSAPEILLSIIEIIGNGFEAGALGPGTIVGSAAFNLFVIIGICVSVIPDGEVRTIKHLTVFFVTATWSVFAYIWMYCIISVITPGEVSILEGVITFICFPLTVVTAWIADTKIIFKRRYRAGRSKTVVAMDGGDVEMGDKSNHVGDEVLFKGLDSEDAEIREFEKHRKEYIEILRDLRKKHPNLDMKALEEMAEFEAMNRGPKSRAFYRIQATRKLTGGGNVIKKSKIHEKNEDETKIEHNENDNVIRVFFEPGHYTVMENVGTFEMTVTRQGGNDSAIIYVDYKTEDGTANAGSDFEYAEGTIEFQPGEHHKQFSVSIIDDDIFEEDEHFYVRLSNLRVQDIRGGRADDIQAQLANPSMATVMILDDDHAGIFHFDAKEVTFPESCGEGNIKVTRSSGARGKVKIPYRTVDGSAKGGKDYEVTQGELVFENDEIEQYIKVRIIDDEEYEKNEVFYVELGEPRLTRTGSDHGDDSGDDDEPGFFEKLFRRHEKKEEEEEEEEGKKVEDTIVDPANMTENERIAQMGKPMLGEPIKIACHISESMEFKSTVDKLLKKANLSLVVGTSSWREQFIDAITVSAGDDDDGGSSKSSRDGGSEFKAIPGDDEGDEDDEGGEEKLPTCMDYVMHFLTIFWKVLFAFVPPTDIWDGWACFIVSICGIGVLTAFIGDIASGFGCTIGLKDSVTAISFVALGTSLPDTFASKVAATQDPTADSSIGNVTGSNAVNVFLGIGIAWTIAAIKHAIYDTTFYVSAGSLAFSVTVFCCCAVACISLILARRWIPAFGGELGGPRNLKIPCTAFMFGLWVFYVIMSSLESYCHIKGF